MTSDTLSAAPLYPPTVSPLDHQPSLARYIIEFIRNPLAALPRRVFEEPLVPLSDKATRIVWLTDPALVESVLLSEQHKYTKTPVEKRAFGPTLGNGILTSNDEAWRWQRKIAAPLFRHGELLQHVSVMSQAAEQRLGFWCENPKRRVIAVDEDMTDVTFDVITRTILAGCDPEEGEIIKRSGKINLDHISWVLAYAMLRLPTWVPHPGKRRMMRAAAAERDAVFRLITRRRAEGGTATDILARLLAARHPDTGEPMSDAQLADNLLTFLIAGHETTAKALAWTLYLLARASEWQQRIRDEVTSVSGGRPITAENIERLPLTQRVLKESLRLYPAAPVVTRVPRETVTLAGVTLAPGTLIIMPIFAIHRHRRLWQDPDRFDPNRFLPEHEKTYKRTQFMPFGFGPRTCIGSAFALLEATTLLATFVRGARFEWDGRHLPEPISRVTLRPSGGMPLYVTPLKAPA
jgi:cytochrome P450